MTLFLAGDVMTGRGIDQILGHPSSPELHEPCVADAREYVQLAETRCQAVPRRVDPAYIWGDALAEWDRRCPVARVVNLETSITLSDEYDSRKNIHYRMHPANVACLGAARLDVCVLANNHVLDFGRHGLDETLEVLEQEGIAAPGAGRTFAEAAAPAVVALPGGRRLIVAAAAVRSSGVPDDWAAGHDRSGVHLLPDLGLTTATALAESIAGLRRPGDVALVSLHWGGNWGYEVPAAHVTFAHALIDNGIDLVHAHSSHHPRPFEIYRERLILYGCGDFLNDYEGISGYEQYRGDLSLMFFPALEPATGHLIALSMVPMQIRSLRLNRASQDDARWMGETLSTVSERFGVRVEAAPDGALRVAGR